MGDFERRVASRLASIRRPLRDGDMRTFITVEVVITYDGDGHIIDASSALRWEIPLDDGERRLLYDSLRALADELEKF